MLEMMLLGQKIYVIPWKAQEAPDEWISQVPPWFELYTKHHSFCLLTWYK